MVIYLPVAADSEFRPIFEDKFFTTDLPRLEFIFRVRIFLEIRLEWITIFFTFKFVKKLRSDQRNLRSNFSAE